MSTVAFIGLGIMGRPMAGHLIAAGHELYLYGRSAVPSDLLEKGAKRCRSSAEAASKAEIVITMLPDTPDVEQVLFGKDGTLTIMVGGPENAFERARPLFEKMGKNVTLVGGNGDGQTCKVANQIIVALNIEAVAEALLFASKMGADPDRVRKALMGGFASSKVLEVHGERMVKRTFNPGFRIELHQKDLAIALSNARSAGLSLPNTATAQELFNACSAHGGKGWDHSALVRALEFLAGFEIGQPSADSAKAARVAP
jgi:2-hydroxy-3-oxopropionate reductase